jgi:hypothetical protein
LEKAVAKPFRGMRVKKIDEGIPSDGSSKLTSSLSQTANPYFPPAQYTVSVRRTLFVYPKKTWHRHWQNDRHQKTDLKWQLHGIAS